MLEHIKKLEKSVLNDIAVANARLKRAIPNPVVRHVLLATAALATSVGSAEVIAQIGAEITEQTKRISIAEIKTEPPSILYRYSAQADFNISDPLTSRDLMSVSTAEGEILGDRPDLFLGKWEPLNLNVGETYDITTYRYLPLFEENIRTATPVRD